MDFVNKESVKEKKGPLRNFHLVESADAAMNRRADRHGKTYTKVMEDLLLGRRLFGDEVESFITRECARTGVDRWTVIESAMRHGAQMMMGASSAGDASAGGTGPQTQGNIPVVPGIPPAAPPAVTAQQVSRDGLTWKKPSGTRPSKTPPHGAARTRRGGKAKASASKK